MYLYKRVKRYLAEENLLPATGIVLAAVSGGRDSMALADILSLLQDELGFQLAVASFDHQLREGSAAETDFVRHWAHGRGLAFISGTADIPLLSQGRNVEDTARRERYAFLRSALFKLGGGVIATAHHREDQAETVLLHLLRGSGPTGLAAMRPEQKGIIRPLLCASRAEIDDYVRQRQLAFCEDETNSSPHFLRNRIRLELLPLLRDYNPRIAEALCATAAVCRDEDSLLAEMAALSLAELWSVEKGCLRGDGFDALAVALRRRVLRLAFCLTAGEGPELTFSQAEAILNLKEGQSCTLPGNRRAFRRSNDLYFAASLPEKESWEEELPLVADGQWRDFPAGPFSYCALLVDEPPFFRPGQMALPADFLPELRWRARRTGDSVPSRGKAGKRKVKEIFIDGKIPRWQRDSWPILIRGEELLWVPGLWQGKQEGSGKCVLIKIRRCDNIYK